MIDINQLTPYTITALKQIYTERRETIKQMQKYGTAFEKAVALVILTAGGEESA
jgi:hypothetical protein